MVFYKNAGLEMKDYLKDIPDYSYEIGVIKKTVRQMIQFNPDCRIKIYLVEKALASLGGQFQFCSCY